LCGEFIANGARIRSNARRFIVMYLRFVVDDIHLESGRELGVFHAVGNLRDHGRLNRQEEARHDVIRKWFNQNLEKPTRFTAAKPPFYRKQARAISWFKDSAREHIARVRELVAILEHHGISVRMLKTDRVGYVVCEDEFQIVAEPSGWARRAFRLVILLRSLSVAGEG
jgi:hypothetical protein